MLPPNGKMAYTDQEGGAAARPRSICSIHPWMKGYVFIIDHPFAAVTKADGSFEITGVPAGKQQLVVWQSTKGYVTEGGEQGDGRRRPGRRDRRRRRDQDHQVITRMAGPTSAGPAIPAIASPDGPVSQSRLLDALRSRSSASVAGFRLATTRIDRLVSPRELRCVTA